MLTVRRQPPEGGTKYLVELVLMIAIIFVMAFTPLGYLRTPGLSITFLTVPVAVAAMILGPKGGAICGAALTQSCAAAWAGQGIYVNGIAPGNM